MQSAALVVEDHDVDGAGEDSTDGFELMGGGRLSDDIDSDDDVDIHLADHVGGKVIDDAAIPSTLPLSSCGVNTPGMAMDARKACANEPSWSTTA